MIAQARERAYAQVEQELNRQDGMNEYFDKQSYDAITVSHFCFIWSTSSSAKQTVADDKQISSDRSFQELLKRNNMI